MVVTALILSSKGLHSIWLSPGLRRRWSVVGIRAVRPPVKVSYPNGIKKASYIIPNCQITIRVIYHSYDLEPLNKLFEAAFRYSVTILSLLICNIWPTPRTLWSGLADKQNLHNYFSSRPLRMISDMVSFNVLE